jgi:hypothetical protein
MKMTLKTAEELRAHMTANNYNKFVEKIESAINEAAADNLYETEFLVCFEEIEFIPKLRKYLSTNGYVTKLQDIFFSFTKDKVMTISWDNWNPL